MDGHTPARASGRGRPVARGYDASHFGIRADFFVTAGLCAPALLGLNVPFMRRGSAALSLSGAFVLDGALARVAAVLLPLAARDLVSRRL